MTDKKPKIEAIYPLSSMQQGLLFHHLMEGEDEGFLMVQCNIEGNLDLDTFKKAWKAVTARHEIMRTSVHWKKVKQPVLLVQPEKEIEWSFIDWSHKNKKTQDLDLEDYKKDCKKTGATLDKNPLSKITLIQKTTSSYYFLWECHHLLLDGWSSTIIIRDVFFYYKNLLSNSTVQLQAIPNFKSYNNWLKTLSKEDASLFWNNTFSNFNGATLFQQQNTKTIASAPVIHKKKFSVETSNALKQLAKKHRVTLNTFFQGVWSIALSKYFNKNDVTFGNTVSGRSIDFPNIQLMAGMFANVLPVRATLANTKPFQENLQSIQLQQQAARNYEYCTVDQISKWADTPKDKPLFDSLFVFENFPWEDITAGDVTVTGFESGITTTYPITTIFKIEDTIEHELLINKAVISEDTIDWFLNIVPSICTILLNTETINILEIIEKLPKAPEKLPQEVVFPIEKNKETTYVAPRNKTELALVEIWEQLFTINYLSITDNFFQLGGKSLLSVKMCILIEEKLGVKLPPTTLLEHPTIKELSVLINSKDDDSVISWKYLIPIKTKGKKAPLFCIHAGGGHVFFYKDLADAIDKNRPVYALQPIGIFGEKNKHKNIENMARDYADEISLLQPNGTLNIVVYCFSTAVGLEMASYLKTKGREAQLIVADTIAEHRLLLDKERFLIRTSAFFKRFFKNPFKAFYEMIGFRLMFYIKPLKIKFFGNDAEKNTEKMRLHLVNLFNAYQWKTKIDNVSLLLTIKGDERYNKEIERSWKPLVNKTIKIENCQGKHSTFFEKPDVIETAKAIDKIIIEY